MPLNVACPACGSSFRVADQHIGKQGKCPKCQNRFVIGGAVASHTPPLPPPAPPQVHQSFAPTFTGQGVEAAKPSKYQAVVATFGQGFSRGQRGATIAIILLSLAIGYFAGREHLKYEARSALETARADFAKNLQNAFVLPDSDTPAAPVSIVPPAVAPGQLDPADDDKAESPAPIDFGTPHAAPDFLLSVTDARVKKLDITTSFAGKSQSKDAALVVTFRLQNTNDRKILRFQGSNTFAADKFIMRDDVDNAIRGISFGFGTNIDGALDSTVDIAPGAVVTHAEAFTVPPPKTQFLIVTVDLAAFNGEGTAAFKIPVNKIADFPR